MNNFKRDALVADGFLGFVPFRRLCQGAINSVPSAEGVYVVMREIDDRPAFLEKNPGGWFKGRNPTVSKSDLPSQWVSGAHVIYIGKGNSLQRRVKRYLDFGLGKPAAHWGGRLIWQVEQCMDFVLAWKLMAQDENAVDLESRLLEEFCAVYGRLPFANLRF
jgi:hypothetical protein